MKQNVRLNRAVCLLVAFIAVPAMHSMSGPSGCTGPIATFCSVSATCIQGNSIYGNAIQGNTVIANSFATPAGPLVSGIGNYGVFLNSFGVASGDFILWGDTPASNFSAGITFDSTTGYITLPSSGIFLVLYSVRFNLPGGNAGTGFATLYQGPAGGPLVQITPPPSIMSIFGVTDVSNLSQPLLTGYAIITVTSPANNTIGLNIQLFNGMMLPGAQGDENAEIVVLQLR